MSTALVRPYCTLAQVQKETRNDSTEEEDIMGECINRASRFVEEYCRADFWKHDHSASPLEIGEEMIVATTIYLPWPIVSLSLVEDITGDNAVTISTDDYRVRTGLSANDTAEHRGMVVNSGRWPTVSHKNSLRLTGVFGYTLAAVSPTSVPPTNLPAAVNRAVVMLASTMSGSYNKQWRDAGGQVQEMLVSNVPKEVFDLLKRWRRLTM